MATKSTSYLCQARVRHDGKLYQSGDTVTLSLHQATPLLALGAIQPLSTSKAGAGAPAGKANAASA